MDSQILFLTGKEIVMILSIAVASSFATESVKRLMRKFNNPHFDKNTVIRSMSFVFTFSLTIAFYPNGGTVDYRLAAIALGFGVPTFYRVAIWALDKKYPGISAIITGRDKPDASDKEGA